MATAKLFPFWKLKKAAYYCPSGEQIINGGFETGDTTGWKVSYTIATSDQAHSGTYSAHFVTEAYIKQAFSLRVECVQSLTLWVLNEFPPQNIEVEVIVHYDDGTSDKHEFVLVAASWTQLDMKPYLTAGKTIDYIQINAPEVPSFWVDDVSLIGTG